MPGVRGRGEDNGRAAEPDHCEAEEELQRSAEYDHVGAVFMDVYSRGVFAVYAGVADHVAVDWGGCGVVGCPSNTADVGAMGLQTRM